MDFPDHVLFNINVAVVAMILRKKYGFEFEQSDASKSTIRSNEMWDMTEKLHDVLIECLKTDDAILDFINWFFDGVRKTFEPKNNFLSQSTSSFPIQYQQQILVYPDICFQCEIPYTSAAPQDKWCKACESHIFESKFHTWTSGNLELDRFIRQTQLNATDSTKFLKWIPFSAFTDLNKIGKGGFSEVYTGNYNIDRLDGTLKQWVTNMEHQIILNYMQSRYEDKELFEKEISLEDWEIILVEFTAKMRNIFHDRKTLKCKPRVEEENSQPRIKRSNSLTKLKNLLKRNSSKKKNKKSLLNHSKFMKPKTRITQVPATVSPIRNKLVPKTVVLKRLVDSQNLSSSFIDELKTHYHSLVKSSKVPIMYGLTQDPQTKDYFIVSQYANELDLHRYLTQNCASIDWWQRINMLNEIVKGIFDIHSADLVHRNLHTGNILVRHSKRRMGLKNTPPSVKIWISDSGLCGPAGSSSSENNDPNLSSESLHLTSGAASTAENNRIYGVLPYVAPEVLQGKEYTASSDIYSLGIIMWELSNSATLKRKQRHEQPFHDQPYDINLATEIVKNQKRPDISDHAAIPECWLSLMKKCWAPNPDDRPVIDDIMKITGEWNMERRKSLESKSSLTFSLSQGISVLNNNPVYESVAAQFSEAEKRRVERLNKGKQVERGEEKKGDESKENEPTADTTETVNQDDDIHPEALMKSRLINFVVQVSSSNDKNLEIIRENPNSLLKKVDSGYQQNESKQIEDETEPEKIVEKEKDSNKHVEEKKYVVSEVIEPILVQENKTKHVKIDDNQIEVKQDNKQSNQDSPIKNEIEANSETGSKEITITKEKEP